MEIKGFRIEAQQLIKSPTFAIRCICFIFSLVVVVCLNRDGYALGTCVFYSKGSACSFGIAIGVIAILFCILFMIVDALFNGFEKEIHRRVIAASDTGFSGVLSFIYFVAFCYMTNQWQNSDADPVLLNIVNVNNIRASIAFAFFSILSWAGLTYAAFYRYRATVHLAAYVDNVLDNRGDLPPRDFGAYNYPEMPSYPNQYDSPTKPYSDSKFVTGRSANDNDILEG